MDSSLLPTDIRPLKYQITLVPNLDDFTFWGEATIDIEVRQATSQIVLNAAEIDLQAAYLLHRGHSILPHESRRDADAETVTFGFRSPLPPGTMQLSLRFNGRLNDNLRGFYRSEYTSIDGRKQFIATTQLEPADARYVFPCWDEPAIKATFELTVIIPAHLTAISNMPIATETPHESGTKVVQFEATPIMSTYLLALTVGEFQSIEVRSEGTLIRVWTTPGKQEQGRFALDVAQRILPFLNHYFALPYPLPKLDLIAIPDFAAGAMENWGAIIYRETALLVDPEHSSAATKQRVAIMIAHEISHQWFGNLVTMQWWNDLWLKEGFASWIEYKAVAHIYPEWEMWTQFTHADLGAALALDGLENSHPVEAEVKNPNEIGELFDSISYSKGAAIIRMLDQFLGEETFRRGLVHYLSAHQYGNACTDDLWDALAYISHQPVKAIMDTWTKQAGYPFLEVESRDVGGYPVLKLMQHRFLYTRDTTHPDQAYTLWHIPVGVRSASAAKPVFTLLEEREGTVRLPDQLPAPNGEAWIKVNVSQTGFFRVNYSPDLWERFYPALASRALPTPDRLGLQADAFALMRAGYLQATQYLSLVKAYTNERDYAVWSDLAANLGWVSNLLAHEPYYPQFKALGRALFRPIVERIGWNGDPQESHLDALLRGMVIQELGLYGEAAVLQEAQVRFARFGENPPSVHPDLRGAVLNLAAFEGDHSTFEILRTLARQAEFQEEKIRALVALTHFTQPELLHKTLMLSLSSEVRSQDTVKVVAGVAANPHGREIAWEFVTSNWGEFDHRYGGSGSGFLLMKLIESVTSYFTTDEKEREVYRFFQKHAVPVAARTVQQSLERIRNNTQWLLRNRESLATLLE